MRTLTHGGLPLKLSQISSARSRPSKMRFISGIPGSIQRLASCGPIKIDDQEYLTLRAEEILAKLSGIAKAASGMK
jgi:hypothetical protein